MTLIANEIAILDGRPIPSKAGPPEGRRAARVREPPSNARRARGQEETVEDAGMNASSLAIATIHPLATARSEKSVSNVGFGQKRTGAFGP
jgi:hypothetical protein